jgi:XTP/dITP diphosphohydrolase
MPELIFASTNFNKIQDLLVEFEQADIHLTPLDESITVPTVDEYANTYFGNAIIKAEQYYSYLQRPCLSDDSGIEIVAFNNGPGVYSGRFLDHLGSCELRNLEVLKMMVDITERKARMISVMCVCLEPGKFLLSQGVLNGQITSEPRGERGWGYESIFAPDPEETAVKHALNKVTEDNTIQHPTMAEMRDANDISNFARAQAARKMVSLLSNLPVNSR